MQFKSSFSFINTKMAEAIVPNTNIKLVIRRLNSSIAELYFLDELNEVMDIPNNDIIIKEAITNKIIKSIPDANYYILAWCDSYHIFYCNKAILNLQSQRQWAIYSNINSISNENEEA